ncbi:MAG: PilZ domain-containing protein [Oligoflexia bacterium]|nr:PilZ domain-containing protein [Oligoflexia bacterium]MBF0365835.1 PilZ domain-containing protein [Oligoflexia bacterium]
MMKYLQEERRKHFRWSVPFSAFEYKGKLFDVLNISAQGLLVKNEKDHDEDLCAELLSSKNFAFNLVDKSSNSKLLLNGNVVRVIKKDTSIMSFAIQFSPINSVL